MHCRIFREILISCYFSLQIAASINNENSRHHERVCLASNLIDLPVDGYHYYPLDLFAPQFLLTSNSTTQSYFLNCSSTRAILPLKKEHICSSNFNPCPVFKKNIRDATKRSNKWMQAVSKMTNDISGRRPPYLYRLWETMFDPNEIIRVVALGGSGALGADSQGCYCQPRIDSRCNFNKNTMKARKGAQEECRWANPFTRWLNSKSLASVLAVNMAVAAATPYYIASDFIRRLKELKINTLSHKDIIFIDYSLNEKGRYSIGNNHFELENGMERLIRTILSVAVSPHSVPTIVLLETYPFPSPGGNFSGKVDYAQSYTKLAQYYRIPIWSFRDVYWSEFATTNPLQSPFIAELRPPDHPVWYVHLFFADIMAGIMQHEFENCFRFPVNLTSGPENIPYSIPPPLVQIKDFNVCDEKEPSILDMSAQSVFHSLANSTSREEEGKQPVSRLFTGDWRVQRGNVPVPRESLATSPSWRLYEDRPRKFGWINEIPESDQAVESTILFDFKMPAGNGKFLLLINYLRTYSNAGRVQVLYSLPFTSCNFGDLQLQET